MTEQMMLSRLHRHDQYALECLIDQYSPYLSSIVWGIVQGKLPVEDAEEIVSDVFLAIWNQSSDVRPGYLRPWLASVARHKAKNRLRKAGWNLSLEDDLLELSDNSDLEKQAEDKEVSQLIRQAVDGMEEPDREIFLRHYYYLQPINEISQKTGLNENTIKTRLRRGRMRLKNILSRWGVA